ncbi:MAG: glycosyltransferase family A protein [bacterium]
MNDINSKISVIIPCYNYGKYINETVDSVLAQTYQNFEIIIVNDGSTDEYTNNLLKNYDKPKTRVINIENQGVSKARNIGIKEAKGTYILPLDADDKIEKTFFQKAVEILDSDSEIGLVFSNYQFFGKFNKTAKLNYKFPEYLILNNCAILITSFFRKADFEKIGGFNANMVKGLEDYNFLLLLISSGVKVHHINETLIYYRQLNEKTSRSNSLNLTQIKECYYQIYKNHEKLFQENIKVITDRIVDTEYEQRSFKKQIKYLKAMLLLTILTMLAVTAIHSLFIYFIPLYFACLAFLFKKFGRG